MFYLVLLIHWLADFVLQPRHIAETKSKDIMSLVTHTVQYSSILAILTALLFSRLSPCNWVTFVCINGITHMAIDYVTSRFCAKMFKEGRTHDFFIGLGLDQMLHTMILYFSWEWLGA